MGEFPVLRDLGYVLGAAALLLVAVRPLRVPPILTYMVAGLVIGPLAGLLTVSGSLHLFAELGVALLLFLVGLELSLEKIRVVGRVALLGGMAQVGLTFGMGFALGRVLGFDAGPAAFLGLVAAFSSTVVVVKLLDRLGDLDALYGRLAIGVLLVQDLLVAVALTIVNGLGDPDGAGVGASAGEAAAAGGGAWIALVLAFAGIGALVAAGAAAVRWVLPRFFDWLSASTEALFVASLTWAFAFILAAEALHVSVELGAFIAGVLLAQLPYNEELRRRVHPLVDFFLVVFFVALGAQLEPGHMLAQWPAALALTALVLLAKPTLTALLLRRLGTPLRDAIRAGITLGQVSEFAFILVGLAIGSGLLDEAFLGLVGLAGILTIGASAVAVPRAGDLAHRLARRIEGRPPDAAGTPEPPERPAAGHVVVVGMNTLGRLIVSGFVERGATVLALDTDPAKLAGLPAATLVGSADDPRVLAEAGVPRARLVVSALQIEDVNSLLAYRCRRLGVPVSVHAFETSLIDELLEIGADHLMISKYDGIQQMETELRRFGVFG